MYTVALKTEGPTPRLLKRVLNDCHRDAAANMGSFWHERFREKHFTNAASSEYGYHPRQGERGRPSKKFSSSYTGRKLREKGHTRPLVYTGESERRTRQLDVRATAKRGEARVRVVLHAPALNFRYAGSPIDMRDEVTTVSQREADAIAEETAKFLKYRYRLVREPQIKQFT